VTCTKALHIAFQLPAAWTPFRLQLQLQLPAHD
jgi:hypothetical protein